MSNWNFNINEAPKSYYEDKEVVLKGKKTTQKVFVPIKIITASVCGIVTASYYIPKENRWNMYSTKTDPIAWQIYPEHPNKGD